MKAVSSDAPRRFRPQYGLRSLLALVTVVSVPLGFWAAREHAYRELVATVTPLVQNGHVVSVEKAGRGPESSRQISSVGALQRDDVVIGAWCGTSDKKAVAAILSCPTLKELGLRDRTEHVSWGSLTALRGRAATRRARQVGPCVMFGEVRPLGAIDPFLREVADKLPSLEKLDLTYTSVGGEGLRHLTALRSLRWLDLSRTRISDSDLAHVPSMCALEVLILEDTGPNRVIPLRVHPEFATVRATKDGRDLTSGHEITDEGLRRLAGASRLRALRLRDASVTGVAFKHLASLTRLEEVKLFCTDFNDEGARYLAALRSIKSLDLTASKITPAALADISTMRQLSTLSLWATAVDDASLGHLAKLPRLRHLNLRETHITDAGLMELAALPSLEWLELDGASSITAAGVARLQALRPQLQIRR